MGALLSDRVDDHHDEGVVEAGEVAREVNRVVRSYAPATGELLREMPSAGRDEVRAAVERAKRAQEAWAVLPVEERAERLLRFRDAVVDRADEIVDVLVRECGKPRHDALLHEVMTVASLLGYYCRHAGRVLAPEPLPSHIFKHRAGVVQHIPFGVVGVISPWNLPFAIPVGAAMTALFAGNAAVVKPSEAASLIALKAKEIYDSTGLPEDLFTVVVGHGETAEALIDAGIARCVFTGSVETGKKVAAACGARLVPCSLELGGKAPLIARADADVERTARAIVYGGFANAGQMCIGVERVYAHEAIHDSLVARVKALVEELRVGNPAEGDVDVGAVIVPRPIDVAERLIADALQKGANLVTGGRRRPGPGRFFEPTVLAGCTPEMAVMQEEIFGPIVPIQKVKDDEEALRLANDSSLGLNAYVFTRDRTKGRRLAERIHAGNVVVNDVLVNYGAAEAPFGGINHSGFGRVHGDQGLREMCQTRYINVERWPAPSRSPLWFPYTAKSYRWIRRAVRLVFAGGGIVQRLRGLF